VETLHKHPKTSHTIDFGYIAETRASVPVSRRSPAADMSDIESDGRVSPSWVDYDDDDDDDVDMEETVTNRKERANDRNNTGPSRIPLPSKGKGKKIPKPIGEAGRPNCGGYNLQRKLNWDRDVFEEIKVRDFLIYYDFSC
jgi:hypothetical protein